MKKIVFGLLVLFLVVSISFAASKILTFQWEQELPDPNDLAGWKLYKAEISGGPYALEKTVNYVSAQTTYTDSVPIIVPDNAVTTLYFVLTAFDKYGNESAYSTEVMAVIDMIDRVAPKIPIQFKITVTTGASP